MTGNQMNRGSTTSDQLDAHFADSNLRFDPGTHEQLAAEYLVEIRELARIAKRPDFRQLLQRFDDYPGFVRQQSYRTGGIKEIIRASGGSGVVDFSRMKNGIFSEAFATAHLAAMCQLLHGSLLTLEQLQSKNILAPAKRFLDASKRKPEKFRVQLQGKLHAMDTMRSIHLLKALGLLSRPADELYQIALGAGTGVRDAVFLHFSPSIKVNSIDSQQKYHFEVKSLSAAETIIADVDPHYKEFYERLNTNSNPHLRAYNMNTAQALQQIEKDVEQRCNLVTGMRIDHRMFADLDEFFLRLWPCLDNDADLLLTIGAGDSVADFKGRLNAFQQTFSWLETASMQPLLFKLHGTGSPAEQRQSLISGNLRASSYQILYCKLEKNKLAAK
ncbi:MAG: hypothetical protein HKO71_07015 [Pseudomonadales bacterium]|nr:hypothetical protein [Pseudomonadales bacterium]